VNAALATVDKVGIKALSIRAVAKQAETPPMSLYSHFANKEALLDLMYAEILRRLYADTKQRTWQAELFVLCRQVRAVLLEHPNWIPLLSRPAPRKAMPLRERLLKLMAADGVSTDTALAAVTNAVLVSFGLVLVELALRGPHDQPVSSTPLEWVTAGFEMVLSTERSAGRAALRRTPHSDLEDDFTLAIRTLIVGVDASRTPPIGGAPNRSPKR